MLYHPENGDGLRHDPLSTLVMPRPIGSISTVDDAGRRNSTPFALIDGIVDGRALEPIARIGYLNYTWIAEVHT